MWGELAEDFAGWPTAEHDTYPIVLASYLIMMASVYVQCALVDALDISLEGLQLSTPLTTDLADTTLLLRPTILAANVKFSRLSVPQLTEVQTRVKLGRLEARVSREAAVVLAALKSETVAVLQTASDAVSVPVAAPGGDVETPGLEQVGCLAPAANDFS